jgi:hypothetical protein
MGVSKIRIDLQCALHGHAGFRRVATQIALARRGAEASELIDARKLPVADGNFGSIGLIGSRLRCDRLRSAKTGPPSARIGSPETAVRDNCAT